MTSFYMLWKFQYLSSVHITVPFFGVGGVGECFKAESNVILIINWNTKLSILVSEVHIHVLFKLHKPYNQLPVVFKILLNTGGP